MTKIISIRENPKYAKVGIKYFQQKWRALSEMIFEDCIKSCLKSKSKLPQWYLLLNYDKIIGCAGLIPNDFLSRMDLYPWLCSLYVEENFRGNSYGKLLIDRAKSDAKKLGFENLYLCTDLIGFYEKYGFKFIAEAHQVGGEKTKVYGAKI
jgi:N-acetylglutamate synthase-like GNAT family acetyltransferase